MTLRRLFLKRGCPFCAKVTFYLAEAGLAKEVTVEYNTEENQKYITEQLGRCSFPALEVEPGKLMLESDDIIALYAKESGIDPADLPLYQDFLQGMLKAYMSLAKYAFEKEGHDYVAAQLLAGKPL